MVVVDRGLCKLLANAYESLGGALALISGRPIRELDTLLFPLVLPSAGVYGLEWRHEDEKIHHESKAFVPDSFRMQIQDFVKTHPGTIYEDKGMSVAVHYRESPEHEAAALNLMDSLGDGLGEDFCVVRGKMMIEIRPRNGDKGTAIKAFMSKSPFRGRIPLFFGDDLVDEAGFDAVNSLSGYAVCVGDTAPTSAGYRLDNVPAVHDWLNLLVRALQDNSKA